MAKQLVVYHRRAGGQSQFSALLELEPKSDRIQNSSAYAKRNLAKPLKVNQLADAAHLSPRQFSRAFRTETGQSPRERAGAKPAIARCELRAHAVMQALGGSSSAVAVEMHEGWLEASRYLNMDLLKEHKKEQLRQLDQAA